MILHRLDEYIKKFGYWIGIDEITSKIILSIPTGEFQVRVFDLTDVDEDYLNKLITESVETGVEKVYDGVKEYEMEIPEFDPNCIY